MLNESAVLSGGTMFAKTAVKELKKHLPSNFTDDFFLIRALTHRSYVNESRDVLEDNERLEFLGDSILSFLVAEWLYQSYPEKKEGFLTKVRSAMVHTHQLSQFARQIELGPALLLGKGEEIAGGRERDAILCDAFEAMIAAMYLSTDIETVRGFVYPLLEQESDNILQNHTEEDVKSLLQEWAQAKGFSSPTYELVNATGPDHAKVFEVSAIVNGKEIARGKGTNKQSAEKSAAYHSMKVLGIIKK
jgi:ribonuclease-3